MSVPYLEDQISRSLHNLDMDHIDLHYIHNPAEGQLGDVTKKELLDRLADAFAMYEAKRKEGVISYYGIATWDCFRSPPGSPVHLSLEEIVCLAQRAGGDCHGMKFIQMPLNLYYDQAFMQQTQEVGGRAVSALEAAGLLGVGVFASAPFLQGRLLSSGVMPEFGDMAPAPRALQFVRSAPGVLAPLAGQKSPDHISENMSVMSVPPLKKEEFAGLVSSLVSRSA